MHKIISLTLLGAGCIAITSCSNSTVQNYEQDFVVDETYVHKYGVEVPPEDWEERGQHGQVVSTLKNGVVVSQTYAAGVLDGDTTYTFPHSGIIERTETYSNGQVVKDTTFYLSGAPMLEKRYNPDGSMLMTIWYENGSPNSVEQLDPQGMIAQGEYYDINHQIDARVENGQGKRIMRDRFGQLMSHDIIQNGDMIQRKTYHPNGTPKEIASFRNGKMDGQRRTFQAGGEPISIEEWSNGNQTGITTSFVNGEKVTETYYMNGIKNGLERRYRDGQTLIEEINWENNIKHGRSVNYLGAKPQIQWFFKGKPVTEASFELQSHQPPAHFN